MLAGNPAKCLIAAKGIRGAKWFPSPEAVCLAAHLANSLWGWTSEKQRKPAWASAGITPPPPPSSDFFLPYVHTHAY